MRKNSSACRYWRLASKYWRIAGVTLAGGADGVTGDGDCDTRTRSLKVEYTISTVLILALDTTTRSGSVAVTDDDRVLAVLAGDESRTHGERLPGEIAAALDRAGIARGQLDLLAVAAGPGGFTGLRIGLATIQGLAMTLNKPVAGVSTLDALAAQVVDANASFVVPWMDAQRGDVFATVIDGASKNTVESAVAEHPRSVLERWHSRLAGHQAIFIGDAVSRDAELIARAGDNQWKVRDPDPLAPQIARIGRHLAQQGRAGAPHALTPIYVRRPDAEIERDKRTTEGAHNARATEGTDNTRATEGTDGSSSN
jgi:tRNA threonylcarbamoyladenosine biosynthesis protein TsaB